MQDLLPLAHYEFKNTQPKKVVRVYGSHLNIKQSDFDFIFGFGAIHNAPDLELLFQSLYASLSDGGYFISSDMCEDFSITPSEEYFLNSRSVPNSLRKYGKNLTFAETSDFFRSPSDYLFYAKKAGFRVYPVIFDKNGSRKFITNFQDVFHGGGINSFYPKSSRGRVDRLLLVCHKPTSSNSDYLLQPSSVKHYDFFRASNMKYFLKKAFYKLKSN